MTSAEQASSDLTPGTLLSGRYRIEKLMAKGGMGAVYLGRHLQLNKKVAIKLLHAELVGTHSIVERFQREALAATQIGHENIIEVTDLGETDDGSAYIVMEYLEGEDLSHRLKRVGQVGLQEAAELISEVLAPIGAAHAHGIIHRDLKPENIFLAKQSRGEIIKVLDFGISRMTQLDVVSTRLTHTGAVLGTPYYMSPEQARGEGEITGQTDIYAIGVILFEMLAGVVPFTGDNYNSLIFKVVSGQRPDLSELRSRIHPGFVEVVDRAMHIDSHQRFGTTQEFAQALRPFCRPEYQAGRMPVLLSQTGDSLAHGSQALSATQFSRTAAEPKPSSPRLWVAAVVAALGVALGAWMLFRGRDSASAQTAAYKAQSASDERAAEEVAAVPPKVEPAEITIFLSVEPEDATVSVDGTPVKGNEIRLAQSARSVELIARAPGFVEHTETLSLDVDQRLRLVLQPEPAADEGEKEVEPEEAASDTRRDRRKSGRRRSGSRSQKGDALIIKKSPYD